MPSPVVSEKRRPQLLTVLFWIGVAFAPIAALILLFADGNGPLRFAAVLAITAVVLIGLSIALRADGGARSSDETVLDELEQLRRELRSEIVAAAQRGNQALDQSQRAEEQVTALRRRLDTAAELAAAVAAPPAEDSVAGAGRARVPAAEPAPEAPVGRRRAAVEEPLSDWEHPESSAPVAAGRGRVPADREAAEPTGRRYAPERPTGQAGVYGAATREPRGGVPAAESTSRPLGVVRHTETVHVTTRHTVVDGPDPAGGYGGGYAGRWASGGDESSWAGGEPERSWSTPAEPTGRGWSARPEDRSRATRQASPDDRAWPSAAGTGWSPPAAPGPGWSTPGDDRPEPVRPEWSAAGGEAGAWSAGGRSDWAEGRTESRAGDRRAQDRADPPARAARAGDRWADVRDEGRAREVRVGERRAEARADGGYHYSDRWASVRQEEPYRDGTEPTGDRWGGARPEQADRPALPAGGVPVPQQWREPARSHRPAEQWPDHVTPPAPDRPDGQWPARAEPQPAREWPARADDRRWEGQRAEQWRDREPVVSWRDPEPEPEPEPREHQQWAGGQRYGYPPQDDVPRAGGHWR
ncbi:hypothetical protein [Micromonospora humidisoli]|uniref:Uncharacterized protein n=1 Tax=Micromonospora humidisoli TaxID=2807622 RepID=A0ABS2J6B4_9ACTN|nr:hypothetical protein [Micromonospora humidisoli]MBM7082103.1 hypothetical protein [Micromonospora humidisoli]